MTEDLKAKYADKIAKLLAKAESTTPEEAEALTAKAQELMSRYAIDEAMLEMARGFAGTSNKVVREEFIIVGIYRFPLADLCTYVLYANDCKIVVRGGKNPREIDGRLFRETVVYWGVGFKSDIDRARLMYTSLMLQAIRAENAWWRENQHLHEHKKKGGHYERRQFLASFGDATYLRMLQAKRAATKTAEKEYTTNSVALAVRDKNALVAQAYDDMFPHLRKGRARNMQGGSWDSHAAGTAAGQRADLGGTKVGTSTRKKLKP